MNRWRVALGIALVLLVAGAAAYADYPGITYNYWVDFEGAALGVTPTTATLAASTHGSGETWIISNPINSLTVVSGAQSGISGATGNRGLQYNDPTGAVAYVAAYLPSTQTSVSMGMWYCTSNQSASGYAYAGGPNFFGFLNNGFGPIWRLTDERNSVDNVRSIRLSPTGPDSTSLRRIPVTDNTCYWVTMKLVKGSTVTLNLYDTSLNLLSSVNTTDSFNQSVDLVWLGNEQKTSSNLAYTSAMDDLIVDYTNANFPLLPKLAPPAIGAVNTFAGNSQHTSAYVPTSQDLGRVKWTTSVNSNTSGTTSRYASPVITAANTVIAPTQIAGGAFQLNAFTGSTGASLYALSTDYVAPTSTTTPVYQPLLVNTASGTRLYYAGAGGTILYIASPDSATPGTPIRQVFYTTLSDYQTRAASFNSTVFINTPLTADANGNVFFGFRVQGTAPSPLSAQDGFARIDTNGNGTFVLAGTAAADATATHDAQNSAPALSNDGTTVYFAAKSASTDNYAYLLGLDSSTLSTKYRVFLTDPRNGNAAGVSDTSTASPVIGPDNDVYFGVSANPDNGSRGFLLHFSSDLTTTKTPGAFGWDNTPAIVSNSMVSSYTGTSTYLLLSNYNDYVGQVDGLGVNKVALLDPTATETDSHSSSNGLTVMREVLNIAGPTPDAANQNSSFPSAVLPWLGNAFAVNAATKTVDLPSSDGNLYRWNVSTDSISQFLNLGAAGGTQNVPTVIGPDGATYTINGSTLASVQALSGVGVNVTSSNPDERTLAAGVPVTFTATVTNGGGSGTPTGTVTFTDTVSTVVGGSLNTTTNTLGSASLNASGIAALTPVTLTTGNHFITANYAGNGTFPAGSGAMVQVVHNGGSSTAITATPNPSNLGQSVTFNVTVSSVPTGGAGSDRSGHTDAGQHRADTVDLVERPSELRDVRAAGWLNDDHRFVRGRFFLFSQHGQCHSRRAKPDGNITHVVFESRIARTERHIHRHRHQLWRLARRQRYLHRRRDDARFERRRQHVRRRDLQHVVALDRQPHHRRQLYRLNRMAKQHRQHPDANDQPGQFHDFDERYINSESFELRIIGHLHRDSHEFRRHAGRLRHFRRRRNYSRFERHRQRQRSSRVLDLNAERRQPHHHRSLHRLRRLRHQHWHRRTASREQRCHQLPRHPVRRLGRFRSTHTRLGSNGCRTRKLHARRRGHVGHCELKQLAERDHRRSRHACRRAWHQGPPVQLDDG